MSPREEARPPDGPAPTSCEYFAPCTLGVEAALVAELEDLGARELSNRPGGVSFLGDRRLGYAANLWSRTAIRVQELILRAPARGREGLYRAVADFDWSRLMRLDQTLAVDASVRDSELTHSNFVGLTVKDAIVDQFRARTGRRPSVDVERPSLPLKVVLQRNVLTVWRNLSGGSLHKRGYRPIQVKSPLNEATAAGLLRLSGWDRASPLVDPMCGSGTLLIEAALWAADRAPGLGRRFPFEGWPDFEASLWVSLQAEARRRSKSSLPFPLRGADRHAGAIGIALSSARAAGVEALVSFRVADAARRVPEDVQAPLTVFTNPPYGERLGEGEDLVSTWRALGAFLGTHARGGRAFVLCGNPDMLPHLGGEPVRRRPFMNGQLDCRLLEYDLR